MKKNTIILFLTLLLTGIISSIIPIFATDETVSSYSQTQEHLGPTVDNICITSGYIYDDYFLGNVIGSINYGETIKVISISDGWAKIAYNHQLAYVNSENLKDTDDFDMYLLAQICYAEAGGASLDEMSKVGQVVLNRINSQYWEFKDCKTLLDVVTQEGQYPETWNKIRNGLVPSENAIKVAQGLLNGDIHSGLSDNVLWQTGFVPSWNVKIVLQTQWHYYSVLKD